MIAWEKALSSDRRMRALTGLDGRGFLELEKRLTPVLEGELATRTREGEVRQRAAGGGRRGVLPTVRHKLWFILFYLKAYPTQDVMGHFFGLSQPQVCARIGQLLPLLQMVLAVELPTRRGRELREVMEHLPEIKEVLIDGTERPLARPQHRGRRDHYYSKRRRRTTVKNVVVMGGGRVLLLTRTAPGRRHDKSEADRVRMRLNAGTRVLGDLGFKGYQAGKALVCTPVRRRPGRRLHWRHREFNRTLASERVPIEHTLASIKRLGILRQTLRARRKGMADDVMLIGCGLYNFRETLRTTRVK